MSLSVAPCTTLIQGGIKVFYATPDHRSQSVALAKKVLFESTIQTQAQGSASRV